MFLPPAMRFPQPLFITFRDKNLVIRQKSHTFAPTKRNQPIMGMTGFDSKSMWYVSMQRVVAPLYNLRHQQFNWRKFLRSRCLIEAQ